MKIELHSERSGTGTERERKRRHRGEWGEGFIGCCAVPTAICLFINYLASKAKRTADECRKEAGQGGRGVARARASKNIDS